MREIKFRGKSENEWVYGYLLKVDEWNQAEHEHFDYFIQTDNMEYEEYECIYITDNNTIGQYTGLKDKNGKEIYEGDKIYIIPEDEYGEIQWDIESARFIVVYDNIVTDFDNWNGKDLEVVGTIYD